MSDREDNDGEDNDRWLQLTKIEERRRDAAMKTYETQKVLEKKEIGRGEPPQKGDLVLLRRFVVDKDKGRKLEVKWEGPYLVTKLSSSGVSVTLTDFLTDRVKGRYSTDALKLYVQRQLGEQVGESEMGDICAFSTDTRVGASFLSERGRI